MISVFVIDLYDLQMILILQSFILHLDTVVTRARIHERVRIMRRGAHWHTRAHIEFVMAASYQY